MLSTVLPELFLTCTQRVSLSTSLLISASRSNCLKSFAIVCSGVEPLKDNSFLLFVPQEDFVPFTLTQTVFSSLLLFL